MFGIKKEPEKKQPITSVMMDDNNFSNESIAINKPVENNEDEADFDKSIVLAKAEIIATELLDSGVYRYFVLSKERFKPGPVNIEEA